MDRKRLMLTSAICLFTTLRTLAEAFRAVIPEHPHDQTKTQLSEAPHAREGAFVEPVLENSSQGVKGRSGCTDCRGAERPRGLVRAGKVAFNSAYQMLAQVAHLGWMPNLAQIHTVPYVASGGRSAHGDPHRSALDAPGEEVGVSKEAGVSKASATSVVAADPADDQGGHQTPLLGVHADVKDMLEIGFLWVEVVMFLSVTLAICCCVGPTATPVVKHGPQVQRSQMESSTATSGFGHSSPSGQRFSPRTASSPHLTSRETRQAREAQAREASPRPRAASDGSVRSSRRASSMRLEVPKRTTSPARADSPASTGPAMEGSASTETVFTFT